jgi:DNA invertase Pin-like site-specific DNA recombinase
MTRYGYARVSTSDQHPEAQAERLRAAGCSLVFTDKGVSGAQARRPKWDKLLALLKAGDELVCTKLDRIARSVPNLYDVMAVLEERNVELVVVDQPGLDATPVGKLLFGILGVIAQFERDLIIDRTRDGQAVVRNAGNLRRSLGGPPVLGYREDPDGDDWQVDPAAADYLGEAARRVLNGEPVEAVHAALPELYDATGRLVNAKMLRAALQRPASAGLISDDYPAAIEDPPLDQQTYDRLAVLFGSRKRGRPAETGRYPLGEVLRCGKCGNQLTGLPGYKRRGYYACRNPHKALGVLEPCRGVSVPAADVHALVRDAITAWSKTPAARRAAAATPQTAARRAQLDDDLADLGEQLADLDAKRLRQRGGTLRARYDALAAEAERMIDAAEAELAQLDRLDAEPGIPAVSNWDALTPAEQLRTIREAFVTPIVVAPGNGGGAALTAADRIDLEPAPAAA